MNDPMKALRELAVQWRHNAQGCGRKDQHAAGTWRSEARELEAALAALSAQSEAGAGGEVDDETILELARKHWVRGEWNGSGADAYRALTYEKSSPMVPQITRNVPTIGLRDFVKACVSASLTTQPAQVPEGGEAAVNGDPWGVTITEGNWTGTYEEWKRRHGIAAPTAKVPEWLPIETAPKDGRDILLAVVERGFMKCAVGGWDDEEESWVEDFRGKGNFNYVPATHWMPLPAAPEPGEGV